jgi:hypothetical protein
MYYLILNCKAHSLPHQFNCQDKTNLLSFILERKLYMKWQASDKPMKTETICQHLNVFYLSIAIFYFSVFRNRVSIFSPSWPQIHPPVSACQVLVLWKYTTMPSNIFIFICRLYYKFSTVSVNQVLFKLNK